LLLLMLRCSSCFTIPLTSLLFIVLHYFSCFIVPPCALLLLLVLTAIPSVLLLLLLCYYVVLCCSSTLRCSIALLGTFLPLVVLLVLYALILFNVSLLPCLDWYSYPPNFFFAIWKFIIVWEEA
jgi:hypothetical protein